MSPGVFHWSSPIFNMDLWYLSGNIPASNCIAAYRAKGASSLAASYVNLANPGTYNASPIVAPGWAVDTGWGFTGTQYLDSGVVVNQAITWSIFIRISSFTTGIAIGAFQSAAQRCEIYPPTRGYSNSCGYLAVNSAATSGVLGVAGNKPYYNGSAEAITLNAGTPMTIPLYIGNRNNNTLLATGNILAIAIYNITLSAVQVSALSTAMAAL